VPDAVVSIYTPRTASSTLTIRENQVDDYRGRGRNESTRRQREGEQRGRPDAPLIADEPTKESAIVPAIVSIVTALRLA
jgi:hypothetical protein